MKKFLLVGVTALSFALAPTVSFARDHGWRGDRWRGDRHYKHRDNDDAIVAGVAGLVIGGLIGSAISNNRNDRYDDRYYAPPPRAYGPPPPDYRYNSYGDDGYYTDGYNGGSYNSQCFRREVVWDPRLRRNVEVTHPIPC